LFFIGPIKLLCYAAQYHAGISTVVYDCVSGFSYSRRQFIINAGAWSVGAALARPFSILAETNSNFPGEPVWTKLSHYGSGVSISGGSVIGFLGGKLPQLTKVHLALCPNALRRSPTFPLSPVYAAGNLIEYEHLESLIQIEQLPVEAYRGITANPGLSTYRHQALTYDLVDRRLADPYGSLHEQQLELLHWPSNSESLFPAYLSGWIDSALYHLKPSASFLQLERIALNRSVSSAKEAEQILAHCVENLPLLAMLGTSSTVERIISSEIVVSSLAALGSSYEKLLQITSQLIVADPSSAQDGAAWTAVLGYARELQPAVPPSGGSIAESILRRRTRAHAGQLVSLFPAIFAGSAIRGTDRRLCLRFGGSRAVDRGEGRG
jgi:hypothetical protein